MEHTFYKGGRPERGRSPNPNRSNNIWAGAIARWTGLKGLAGPVFK